ncbi:delta(24)-sterol C-methyltransferase [Clostridium sp. P21]|uniref:Delta(24)-sterol C-methyltransferase n=1 Tax=Clostridium muellerianum TaxID=2716538 RepID=A0A7Y0ED50_9CLOT|nr:DHH family phosphoesterase [Clostridium muellerianum]NMM61213.1 delta(24)-sterol C-methyltransferase [Clostridium muellerianum]
MEIQERKMQYSRFSGAQNPFALKGMKEALERIIKAVNEREKIVIYGYYDLDGITAVSLLLLVLKYLNADVEYVVPEDMDEDFAINANIIKNHVKFLGAKLIITVGCGVNSVSQVELCKELGIDVIITDYHKCAEVLPETVIVNPNQVDCEYTFKDLTAVGIAFKIAQAISMYYQMKCISKYLDLVMIGTLSRNINLTGENKVMISQGMYHLNYTNNYGLKALIKIHKIVNINKESIYKLAYNIIPSSKSKRTVDNARIAVELFTTSNMDRAEQIAKYLKNEIKGNELCIS